MSGRLPLAVGVFTASAAAAVLLAWMGGLSDAPRLVTGWRVMVPSSAVSFLCAGIGLALAAGLGSGDARAVRSAIRGLAALMLVLPVATLIG